MKVLISAFACQPGRGSESGVGWNWAVQAARYCEVWVITEVKNQEAIESELRICPQPNLHFIYCNVPKWGYWFKRTGPSHKPYYYIWQLFALLKARAAHRDIKFDLIHHLTYNTIDVPGFLWLFRTRFLWGPVGGGQIPPRLMRRYYRHHWIVEEIRALRKRLLRFDPIVRLAIRHADYILAANLDTEMLLKRCGATHISRFPEAGCRLPLHPAHRERLDSDVVTILWSGHFVYRKAPLIALEAFGALIQQGVNARLILTGDGPLRNQVCSYVIHHSLQSHVSVLGWVPHSEMNQLYAEADIFMFTSLSDTSGNVVLEAMSYELPVVALDHQGAGEMASGGAGILIPITSPDQVVHDLTLALARLALNAALRREIGTAARDRVERVYSWDRKGDLLATLYSGLLDGAG